MTVEQQLGDFAAHLAREVDGADMDSLVARLFSKISSLSASDTAQYLLASTFDRDPAVEAEMGDLAGTQHSTSSLRADIPGQFELAASRALAGDPASARRAAEIAELLDEQGQAAGWWLRAAALGDRVAMDYVQEFNIRAQDAEPPVMLPRDPARSNVNPQIVGFGPIQPLVHEASAPTERPAQPLVHEASAQQKEQQSTYRQPVIAANPRSSSDAQGKLRPRSRPRK